jgi:hypothetical protein
LFEGEIDAARANYQEASRLNPQFVPAEAMTRYLAQSPGTGVEPAKTIMTLPPMTQNELRNQQAQLAQREASFQRAQREFETEKAPRLLQNPWAPPGSISSTTASPAKTTPLQTPSTVASRSTGAPRLSGNAPAITPARATTPQPPSTVEAMVSTLNRIQPGRLLEYAGAAITIIGGILEVAELAPLAAAIGLTGMIMQDSGQTATPQVPSRRTK